jgi:hypothetical protein
MEYVTAAAEGRPMPAYTWDEINQLNESRAVSNASVGKAEVLDELRVGVATTSAYIRGLSDEQLDSAASLPLAKGAMVTAEHIIERVVLIDHFRGHLASIRSAES